ncbi:hypothetical protein SNE40_011035 [Patella caerulea]
MASQHDHVCNCSSHQATPSVSQTLDELDFERGIWNQALTGDMDGLMKCLGKGDSANALDKSGYSALHYAARNGHLQICTVLIQHGACINCQTNSGKATPLHRAAYMGHTDIVKLLLKHEADPRISDADGNTPVHKAVKQGHTGVVELLLEKAPELSHLTKQDGASGTKTDET